MHSCLDPSDGELDKLAIPPSLIACFQYVPMLNYSFFPFSFIRSTSKEPEVSHALCNFTGMDSVTDGRHWKTVRMPEVGLEEQSMSIYEICNRILCFPCSLLIFSPTRDKIRTTEICKLWLYPINPHHFQTAWQQPVLLRYNTTQNHQANYITVRMLNLLLISRLLIIARSWSCVWNPRRTIQTNLM